ncbi:MAG: type I methionyl aminopeptidase, partial [Planctomycetota bacterium]
MAITLKSRREIELIRRAGVVVADVLSKLEEIAEPGVTTDRLDKIALQITTDAGAEPLFKGVHSPVSRKVFPGAICASINEQVVHGIPSETCILKDGDLLSIDFGARLDGYCETCILKDGDLLSIDFGARLDGYCGDAAITIGMGNISKDKRRLIEATKHVLEIAIEKSAPAVRWSKIATEMQNYAESEGFSIVRDFVGHGIGRKMHEEPRVPNFVSDELVADDIILTEGMVLAV